jgi:integrase/recombinase XerC
LRIIINSKNIVKFENYLKFDKGYSQLTAKAYLQDLKILFAFEKDIEKINSDKVQTLVIKQNAKGKSAKSVKRLVSSIKSYLQFLLEIGELKKQIIIDVTTPKLTKTLPKTLTYEQIILMIRNCDVKNKKRNSAIIATLYSCGLRVSELVGIDKNAIDFKAEFIKVFGKGGKERYAPIGEKALKYLSDYIQEQNPENAIFINKNGKRLSTRSVQNIISQSGELAGIDFAVTPHMLRHAAASHFLQSSGDLRSTQEYLGHKNITSTQVYTHLDYQSVSRVYDEKHPHGNDKNK